MTSKEFDAHLLLLGFKHSEPRSLSYSSMWKSPNTSVFIDNIKQYKIRIHTKNNIEDFYSYDKALTFLGSQL
jgi:hypothetical protein